MDISVSNLPSGGFGYSFPTVRIKPMDFLSVVNYLENEPKDDPLAKYMFDLRLLLKDDERIKDCYIMDVDFLIFYKKLCTISESLKYELSITCPECGKPVEKTIDFEKDIIFKQIDEKIMNGAEIVLGGNKYETIIPTLSEFMKVFDNYLRYKKVKDIKMIKTIALIKDFDKRPSEVENAVLHATHSDITLLMALRDLYYDRLEPITVFCPECGKGKKPEERRGILVGVDDLISDFFRDLYRNSPIDGSKILFK